MNEFTRRSLLQGGTALAAAGALTGPALLDFAKAWAQAADHFANAARLNPGFADAHIGLGRSLISDSKYEDAIRPLEQAVKLQPENPAARYHLATAYRRAGRKEEAEREAAAFKQMAEKAQRMKQDVQTGVLGPQKAEP